MSSSFRPGREEMIEFAKKANEIEIGGISDLADDMGMSLLTNQNKVNIGVRQESGQGETITIEQPRQASFSDNLEFVNLDNMETVGSQSQPKIDIPNFSGSSEPFVSQQPLTFASVQPSAQTPLENQLSPEQEQREKNSYLTRLQRLSGRGMTGQRMTMTNSLEEIKAEYGRVVDTRNLEASLKFQRNALMTFATGAEFLNNRFNPFEVNLEGWSESVHENVEDYDEIFEELYDKYKDAGKMPPEVRLVMTLGVSAAMFHVTNTYFKSKMPGMDDILRNNPDLMKQFATAAAGQVGPGFGQFVGAAMNTQRGGQQGPQSQQGQMGQQMGQQMGAQDMGGMPFNMSSRAAQAQQMGQDEMPMPQQQRPNLRREMRGPAGVDDILQAFEQERQNQGQPPSVRIDMNAAPIFSPSDAGSPQTINMNILREGVGTEVDPLREVSNILDEMQSVASTSMSQIDGDKKRRGRRTANSVTGGTLTLNV
jgi:hypothetical protein